MTSTFKKGLTALFNKMPLQALFKFDEEENNNEPSGLPQTDQDQVEGCELVIM